MGLARRLGDRWWLPGAAVFVAIAALFTFVAPYLDFTTKPLRDKALLAAAREYRSELGVGDIPLRVEKVSDDTDQANAYAYRHRAVTARRLLGHDAARAVLEGRAEDRARARARLTTRSTTCPRGIGWFALFAIPGAWILMRATRRRGGMGAPEAIPLALLVVAVFQLATAPLAEPHLAPDGGRGRLEGASGDRTIPRRSRASCVGFSKTSLGDPDPPAWAQLDARDAPDARRPRRDGASVRRYGARSACTRGPSRPRAASAGRPWR